MATIHPPELQGQEQVSLPSQVQEARFHSHGLHRGRFLLGVHTTLAAMPHIKNMLVVLFEIGLRDFSETHTSVA